MTGVLPSCIAEQAVFLAFKSLFKFAAHPFDQLLGFDPLVGLAGRLLDLLNHRFQPGAGSFHDLVDVDLAELLGLWNAAPNCAACCEMPPT